jgi:hypothetical protein
MNAGLTIREGCVMFKARRHRARILEHECLTTTAVVDRLAVAEEVLIISEFSPAEAGRGRFRRARTYQCRLSSFMV